MEWRRRGKIERWHKGILPIIAAIAKWLAGSELAKRAAEETGEAGSGMLMKAIAGKIGEGKSVAQTTGELGAEQYPGGYAPEGYSDPVGSQAAGLGSELAKSSLSLAEPSATGTTPKLPPIPKQAGLSSLPPRGEQQWVPGPEGSRITGIGEVAEAPESAPVEGSVKVPASIWNKIIGVGRELTGGKIGVPEAFGKAVIGQPMPAERMGWEAYAGQRIPNIIASKLGVSTPAEALASQQALGTKRDITAGRNRVYKTKEEIPREMEGLPLKSITPVQGGFKATYSHKTVGDMQPDEFEKHRRELLGEFSAEEEKLISQYEAKYPERTREEIIASMQEDNLL